MCVCVNAKCVCMLCMCSTCACICFVYVHVYACAYVYVYVRGLCVYVCMWVTWAHFSLYLILHELSDKFSSILVQRKYLKLFNLMVNNFFLCKSEYKFFLIDMLMLFSQNYENRLSIKRVKCM